MREGIHPEYHPVIFVDVSTGDEIVTRSTMTSADTKAIDGVDHYVVNCDITSHTHPFFTGKQKLVDTEGRIDRFRRRYAAKEAAAKAAAEAAATEAEAEEATSEEAPADEA